MVKRNGRDAEQFNTTNNGWERGVIRMGMVGNTTGMAQA